MQKTNFIWHFLGILFSFFLFSFLGPKKELYSLYLAQGITKSQNKTNYKSKNFPFQLEVTHDSAARSPSFLCLAG